MCLPPLTSGCLAWRTKSEHPRPCRPTAGSPSASSANKPALGRLYKCSYWAAGCSFSADVVPSHGATCQVDSKPVSKPKAEGGGDLGCQQRTRQRIVRIQPGPGRRTSRVIPQSTTYPCRAALPEGWTPAGRRIEVPSLAFPWQGPQSGGATTFRRSGVEGADQGDGFHEMNSKGSHEVQNPVDKQRFRRCRAQMVRAGNAGDHSRQHSQLASDLPAGPNGQPASARPK